METLAGMVLANALVVAAIAPVAALMSRAARRPAWAHALWVIVLLKLVTPPIAKIPIGTSTPRVVESPGAPRDDAPTIAAPRLPEARAARGPWDLGRPGSIRPDGGRGEGSGPSVAAAGRGRPRAWRMAAIAWPAAIGGVWLSGAAAWAALAAWRIGRFARAVGRAGSAPGEVVDRVRELSARLGLGRPPRVAVVGGRVSPMVWSLWGRATLVMPEGLWARLDPDQRDALLVHELAHLRRGDHRVRLLEMAATAFYWWHPALWWARRELHKAEEACCDLWVVWAMPKARRSYATALVEAVEYLGATRPMRLPAGASGMGQVADLSRRLGMILRDDTPRGLSRGGFLAAAGVALLLLPWRPSTAQEPARAETTPTAPAPAPAPKGDDAKPESRAEAATTPAADPTRKTAVDLDDGTSKLVDEYQLLAERLKLARQNEERSQRLFESGSVAEEDLNRAKAEVLEIRLRLAALERRNAEEPRGPGVPASLRTNLSRAEDRLRWSRAMLKNQYVNPSQVREDELALDLARERIASYRGDREQVGRQAEAEARSIEAQLQTKKALVAKAEAQRRLALAENARIARLDAKGKGYVSMEEREKAEAQLAIADAQVAEARGEAEEVRVRLDQARERAAGFRRGEDQRAGAATARPPEADRRLDELETKLDRVLKELEALRKDKAEAAKGADPLRDANRAAVN